MRPRACAPALLVAAATTARAEPPPVHRVEVGVSLGYAFPVGSAETGSRMSDTTIGLVPIEADVAYSLTEVIAVVAWARYGVGIPTLCKTAGDCTSSLGSDVAIAARVRFLAPRLGRLAPQGDLGVGYEWFASRLTDSGVTSTRAYHGPLLFSVEATAPFHLSERSTLGPMLGAALGTFTSYALETPAATSSGAITGRALHLWLSPGVRLAAAW